MPDIDIILKGRDDASGPIGRVEDALGDLNAKSKRAVSDGLGKLDNMLRNGLRTAAVAATAAIVSVGAAMGTAFAASVGKAAGMEQDIADISAVFGKAAPPAKELNKLIQDLGLDPKLKVSAFEAAAAINMLAKNGITWEQIQGGMARSTVLLANATNDDFALAADVATNAMVQFNKNAGDMEGVINGIIGVTQTSQFDINDYALALAQAGGVAGQVGVELDDFNAIIATISSYFNSGSDAGTSFKVFLQRLVPDTKSAADAMRELGLFSGLSGDEFDELTADISKTQSKIASLDTTSKNYAEKLHELNQQLATQRSELVQGSNAFFDANGMMKSGADIANSLATAFTGLSDAQRIEAATNIFGTDAMRTALALADAGTATVKKFKTEIGKTSAEDAAATRMDTLKGSWEILTGMVETLSIQLGQTFLPVARKLVEWVQEMVTEHGPKLIEFFQRIGAGAAVFFDMVTSGAPALHVFKGILTSLLPADIYSKIMNFVAGVQSIIDIVGAILGPFIEWQDVIRGVAAVIGVIAVQALAAFVAAWWPVAAILAGAVAIMATLRHAWEGDWGGIRTMTLDALDAIKERFAPLIDAIRTFGQEALGEIVAWAQGNATEFSAVSEIWNRAKETARRLWQDLVKLVQDNWPKFKEAVGRWATTAWQWITHTAIPMAMQKLGEWANALWQWIIDNTPEWAKRLGAFAAKAWDWLTNDVIPAVSEKLGEWATALYTWVTDNAPEWGKKLAEWGKIAWQWIVEAAKEISQKLTEWWVEISAWMTEHLPKWAAKLTDWAEEAWEWIVDATKKIAQKLGEWWDAVKKWLDETLPKFETQMKNWADALVEWVKNATPKTTKSLGEWWLAVSGWFVQKLPDFTVGLVQWTTGLVEWIGNAISGAITGITLFVESLVVWMVSGGADKGVGKINKGLESWIDAFKNWISGPDGLITRLIPEWQKLGAAVIDAIVNINTAITNAKLRITTAFVAALAFVGTAIVDGIKQGIDSASGGLITKMTDLAERVLTATESALRIDSPSKEFKKIGEQTIIGFQQGIVDNTRLALEAATSLTEQFLAKFDAILNQLPLVARDSMKKFVALFREGMDVALRSASDTAMDFIGKFNVILEQVPFIVRDAMMQFQELMQQGASAIIGNVQGFVVELVGLFERMVVDSSNRFTRLVEGARTALQPGPFQQLGQQVVAGFISGLGSMFDAAQAKVAELANLATKALATTLEAQSPSRRFHRYGQWAGQGFINGMHSKLGEVRSKALELAQVASQAVQNSVQSTATQATGVVSSGAISSQIVDQVMQSLISGQGLANMPDYVNRMISGIASSVNGLLRDDEYYRIVRDLIASGTYPQTSQLGELSANDYRLAQLQELHDKLFDAAGRGSAQAVQPRMTTQHVPENLYRQDWSTNTLRGLTNIVQPSNPLSSVMMDKIMTMFATGDFPGRSNVLPFYEDSEIVNQLMDTTKLIQNFLHDSETFQAVRDIIATGIVPDSSKLGDLAFDQYRLTLLPQLHDNLFNELKMILGIHSPSTKFAWLGEMSAKGFVNGFSQEISGLGSTISGAIARLNNSNRIDNRQVIVQVQGTGDVPRDVRNAVDLFALQWGASI